MSPLSGFPPATAANHGDDLMPTILRGFRSLGVLATCLLCLVTVGCIDRSELESAKAKLRHAEEEHQRASEKLARFQQEHERLQEEHQRVSDELSQIQKVRERLQEQHQRVSDELSQIHQKYERLQSQSSQLAAKIEQLELPYRITRGDGPDLVISALSAILAEPNRLRYSYTVRNVGTKPANLDGSTDANHDNLKVQAFISNDSIFRNQGDLPAGGTIVGRSPLGMLMPGESKDGEFAASIKGNVEDLPFLILKVDSGKAVEESNEDNNTAVAPIFVPQ